MKAIIIRVLTQMKNDRRSLILLLGAPLLVLTLLHVILGDSDYVPKIAVYEIPPQIEEVLKEAEVTKLSSLPNMSKKDYLKDNNIDALIWSDSNEMHVYMIEKNDKTTKVLKLLSKAQPKSYTQEFAYQTRSNQLDSLSYVFIGILSFFFVFILSGMAFVRERFEQTLERMLMTPLRRAQIIGGYTIGYGILAAVQSILIIIYAVYVLKLHIEGNILLAMSIMVLMAVLAVLVGALLSIYANNELQLVQFIPVIIIPQIFFSGLISLDTIPLHLGNLKYIVPAYYGCVGLKQVLVYGESIEGVYPYLLGLLAYSVVLFMLNTVMLKKYRRI